MADVFLSYKREDQPRVRPLAEALTGDGLKVFWDVDIEGGSNWRRALERELDAAACVIVAWSAASIGEAGAFVQDEAARARARGVYLPLLLDPVAPPLGFGQVHSLSLVGWNGRRRDEAYQTLLRCVRAMTTGQGGDAVSPAPTASTPTRAGIGGGDRPRLAVLAFRHPAGDDEQAFAEALGDDLIAGLAKSRLVAVTPRQSSLTYDPSGRAAPAICADLGVDYILQGQVRRIGSRIRVSADLVAGDADRAVWSTRLDRNVSDLFALLDEMTLAIVGAIEPALLSEEEASALRRPAPNPGHWDLFVRGRRHFWRSTHRDTRQAQGLFEAALKLSPDDSQTHAFLAHCHLFYIWADVADDQAEEIEAAHNCAIRAVGLDPSDAYAHFTLGTILAAMKRRAEARAEFLRALDLNPYLATAAGSLGRLDAYAGNRASAISWTDRALAMSPNDPHLFIWQASKAVAAFIDADHDAALGHALETVALAPFLFPYHFLLAACYADAGRIEEARRAFAAGRRIKPRYAMEALRLGFPFEREADHERFVNALRGAGWAG